MIYLLLFLISLVLAILLVPLAKKVAFKFGAIDIPNVDPARRIHTKPTPLLGGFAIFLSFAITVGFFLWRMHPNFSVVPVRFYMGIISGGLILMAGGLLDDIYKLSPKFSVIAPILATLVLIYTGIGVGITQISNPLGNPINLAHSIFGIRLSAIFIFIFVMGMIYTTKFLDGMDGLASGISLIASLTLFILSLTPRISQDITAAITIIFCGALFGFLLFNFNPASIFLGESGSTFVGFMLGALSVLLGGKIATAVLVMGVPILDVAWVIVRRLWFGGSPFAADRKHLHFRLLDIGFSQRQTVLILYGIAAIFGFVAIFLQSLGKLISMIILLCVMVALAMFTVVTYKRQVEKPAGAAPENSVSEQVDDKA